MIYPIVVYGDPILRKKAEDVKVGLRKVKTWSQDMFKTTAATHGIGLAAPQIGKSLRLFVVNGELLDESIDANSFKQVFINPEIIERSKSSTEMNEGCLSIPTIREDIVRPEKIKIKFFDADWNFHEKEYQGMQARIIQHEYDHVEGVLFIDHLSPIKKRLLRKKLSNISKGEVDVEYDIYVPVR